MKKKKLVFIIFFIGFTFVFLCHKKPFVRLEKVNRQLKIIRCSKNRLQKIFSKACTPLAQSKSVTVETHSFFKVLEFSLATPGDYTPDMVANINSYKKDNFEEIQEKKRKEDSLEFNYHLAIHLVEKSSSFLDRQKLLTMYRDNRSRNKGNLLEMIKEQNKINHIFIDQLSHLPSWSIEVLMGDKNDSIVPLADIFLKKTIPPLAFVEIPKGQFIMGKSSRPDGKLEKEHKVTLTQNFEMATFETSQLEWFLLMGYNPSFFSKKDDCQITFMAINNRRVCPHLPVETVSFLEIKEYVDRLNSFDNRYNYRLPTEAEWEYASRAGAESSYHFGDNANALVDYAWFYQNSKLRTQERGKKMPNSFGLYDMHGNVFEWTNDYYSTFNSRAQVDPKVETPAQWRITKGGSWYSGPGGLRSAFRCLDEEAFRYSRIGFRLVRFPKRKHL